MRIATLAVIAVSVLAACSGSDQLQHRQCFGLTACGDECVDLKTDPANCGTCGKVCPGSGSEAPVCQGGQCATQCVDPFGTQCGSDCVDLQTDANHCGTCANKCTAPVGGQATCSASKCGKSCGTGLTLCGDACVDLTSDPNHCKTCDNACPAVANAVATCSQSSCGHTCETPWTQCPGVDACVDVQNDPNHCGKCDRACPSVAGGQAVCQQGSCGVVCDSLHVLSGDVCVDLTSNLANCGNLGQSCAAPLGGTASCVQGGCVGVCASGKSWCGGSATAGGGECVDLTSDPNHCSRCDHVCATPTGGTAACVQANCQEVCADGKSLCPGTNGGADACVDLSRDPLNCHACGHACGAPAGGRAGCEAGACDGVCPAGETVCRATADGGGACASLLTDVQNCGSCGHVCAAPAGGTAACVLGRCAGQCSGTQSVCGATADGGGTCVDLTTSLGNCGGCGHACTSASGGSETCSAGACVGACTDQSRTLCASTDDGGGTCRALQSDPVACGSCNRTCAAPTGGTAACASGECAGTCTNNRTVCGLAPLHGGGQCVDLTSDPNNCQLCGHDCPVPTGGSATCTNGVCGGACATGGTVCDADATTNNGGACRSLGTDPANCGTCDNVCATPTGGTAGCANGSCTGTCPSSEQLCGASPTTGGGRCAVSCGGVIATSVGGGPGDQFATGIVFADNALWVSGNQNNATGGVLAHFPLPLPAAPDFVNVWPASPQNGDYFTGIAAGPSAVYVTGDSYSMTTDCAGGKEGKMIFLEYPFTDSPSNPTPSAYEWFANVGGSCAIENLNGIAVGTEVDSSGNSVPMMYGVGEAQYPNRDTLIKASEPAGSPTTMPSGSSTVWTQFYASNGSANGVVVGTNGSSPPSTALYVVGSTNDYGGSLPIIAAYNTAGNQTWVSTATSFTYQGSFQAVTTFGGYIYAAGVAFGSGNTTSDAVVEKYDTSGHRVWTHSYDFNSNDVLTGILGLGNYIFAVGYTGKSTPFNCSATNPCAGLALEINPTDGTLKDTFNYGTPSTDTTFRGITTDGTNGFVVGDEQTSSSGYDLFVIEFAP